MVVIPAKPVPAEAGIGYPVFETTCYDLILIVKGICANLLALSLELIRASNLQPQTSNSEGLFPPTAEGSVFCPEITCFELCDKGDFRAERSRW